MKIEERVFVYDSGGGSVLGVEGSVCVIGPGLRGSWDADSSALDNMNTSSLFSPEPHLNNSRSVLAVPKASLSLYTHCETIVS
jgi:hypothetical protein